MSISWATRWPRYSSTGSRVYCAWRWVSRRVTGPAGVAISAVTTPFPPHQSPCSRRCGRPPSVKGVKRTSARGSREASSRPLPWRVCGRCQTCGRPAVRTPRKQHLTALAGPDLLEGRDVRSQARKLVGDPGPCARRSWWDSGLPSPQTFSVSRRSRMLAPSRPARNANGDVVERLDRSEDSKD